MIRKKAVQSILAERDILIKAHNPFVVVTCSSFFSYFVLCRDSLISNVTSFDQVRFFYSFTCPEKLYLVMEYLNGGDFYSLLGKLGCLDETHARVYIAEVVSV